MDGVMIVMGEAIFRQKNKQIAVNVVAACGFMTARQFAGLGKIAEELESGGLKMTTRQTVIVLLEENKLPAFKEGLPSLGLSISPFGDSVRAVKACSGNSELCPRAITDALNTGIEIQLKYLGQPVPSDFKIAVAGCPRGCTDPYCADFGIIGCGKDLYDIAIGGRGSSGSPLHGRKILEKCDQNTVFQVLDFVLDKYRTLAEPGERLCKTISRVGIEAFTPNFQLPEKNDVDEEFVAFLTSDE